MCRHIVGEIEGHNVIYIEGKDIVFCKNTAVPYKVIKDAFQKKQSRQQLKEDLYYISDGFNITLGCLNTNRDDFKKFIKNIEKIKLNARRK